mgnify:CR=1 FL=1
METWYLQTNFIYYHTQTNLLLGLVQLVSLSFTRIFFCRQQNENHHHNISSLVYGLEILFLNSGKVSYSIFFYLIFIFFLFFLKKISVYWATRFGFRFGFFYLQVLECWNVIVDTIFFSFFLLLLSSTVFQVSNNQIFIF